MKKLFLVLFPLLAGCAGMEQKPASVERMYVIQCGESVASDLSRWTTSADAGRSVLLSDHCYLILQPGAERALDERDGGLPQGRRRAPVDQPRFAAEQGDSEIARLRRMKITG
jgi:hypothetical protein